MSLAENLRREIKNGLEGKNGIIPLGYDRLDDYIEISKNTMYTLIGETGAGKSTITQDGFIIKPIQWYLANKHQENIKLSIIYFGMERKMFLYTCRWISRLIFEEQGILIPVKKILSKKKKKGVKDLMTPQEQKMVDDYIDRLDEWEKDDLLMAHEGSKNPSGMSKYIELFAKKHGTIIEKEKVDKDEVTLENVLGGKKYIPNHPNHIVLIITDHVAILSPEREGGEGVPKQRIEKFSRTMREARDLYGFSPVIVQQMNRNISDMTRQKAGDVKPKLSDIAETSSTAHDSDVILALHDPYRHGDVVQDMGYDLKKLKNERGDTFYRTVHILKSSFDTSNVAIQMGLHPYSGKLKSLPRSTEITEELYTRVVSGMFFIDN